MYKLNEIITTAGEGVLGITPEKALAAIKKDPFTASVLTARGRIELELQRLGVNFTLRGDKSDGLCRFACLLKKGPDKSLKVEAPPDEIFHAVMAKLGVPVVGEAPKP